MILSKYSKKWYKYQYKKCNAMVTFSSFLSGNMQTPQKSKAWKINLSKYVMDVHKP